MENKSVTIYTDGFCEPNPGKGSWAFVVVEDNRYNYFESGKEKYTTNNRMEILAVINAITWAGKNNYFKVNIYTDSQYTCNGLNKWMYDWEERGWKRRKNKECLNVDLWRELFELSKKIDINIYWVRGHSGNKWNEFADYLCLAEYGK